MSVETDVSASQLETLITDFRANWARLSQLDPETVTASQLLAELRDNGYPSLIALAEEKSAGEAVLMLGDFNTGPAGNGYVGEFPEHFATFGTAGFAAPYVENGGPCTFCGDNVLTVAREIQRHPVRGDLMHADLFEIDAQQSIRGGRAEGTN